MPELRPLRMLAVRGGYARRSAAPLSRTSSPKPAEIWVVPDGVTECRLGHHFSLTADGRIIASGWMVVAYTYF